MDERLLGKIVDLKRDKYSIFNDVCSYGDEKDIENYIKEYNADVNYDDYYPVDIIVDRKDVKLLEMLLRNNADKNYMLQRCSREKFDDGIQLLLRKGARADSVKNLEGYSYLTEYINKHYRYLCTWGELMKIAEEECKEKYKNDKEVKKDEESDKDKDFDKDMPMYIEIAKIEEFRKQCAEKHKDDKEVKKDE